MDCNMPLMSGYEATRILKDRIEKHELPNIHIVACTAGVT
jgi:CheY-like chemotaxis protein